MSDIKFPDNDEVIVEGRTLNVKAPDFLLDFAANRKGKRAFRRALVHDTNDGLSLNFNGDYPAGVTIYGETRVIKGGGMNCDGNVATGGDFILKRPDGDVFFNRLVDGLVTRIEELEGRVAKLEGS